MIVFDLACAQGHVFEGWFGSSDDYEGQRTRGLLTCPICGDAEVAKAVQAPRVGAKGNGGGGALAAGMPPEKAKAMLAAMARMQAKLLEGSEHVGRRFADEARAMHLGEADVRTIHGQATPAEAQALADEGVPIAPLPLPVRPPEVEN